MIWIQLRDDTKIIIQIHSNEPGNDNMKLAQMDVNVWSLLDEDYDQQPDSYEFIMSHHVDFQMNSIIGTKFEPEIFHDFEIISDDDDEDDNEDHKDDEPSESSLSDDEHDYEPSVSSVSDDDDDEDEHTNTNNNNNNNSNNNNNNNNHKKKKTHRRPYCGKIDSYGLRLTRWRNRAPFNPSNNDKHMNNKWIESKRRQDKR